MLPLLVVPLALAACGKPPATAGNDLDALDNQLTETPVANQRDPVFATALRDQIMVDPQLVGESNARAVRPPPRPDPGAMPTDDLGAPADTSRAADLKPTPPATPGCPECGAARGAVTLGALAERQASRSVAACSSGIGYASAWANRLPAWLPLYPDAQVAEAAGNDAGGCSLRVVSFASNAPLSRVSDWYYAATSRAGFTPGHRADASGHVLGGTRGNAVFMLYLRPRPGGGTDADLISNAGR